MMSDVEFFNFENIHFHPINIIYFYKIKVKIADLKKLGQLIWMISKFANI